MIRYILGFSIIFILTTDLFSQHQNIIVGTLRSPNEPTIVINPKNPDHILAAANLDNYYQSFDGGFSWTERRLYSTTFGVWGDPCMVVDTLENYYFFHLSNPPGPAWIDQIVCQKSNDAGATWNLGSGIGFNEGKSQDKEWAIVDVKTNNIYVTWTQFDYYASSDPADSSLILFSKSTDQGVSWSEPTRISKIAGNCLDSDSTVMGAVPAIGPEGEIFVSWIGPNGLMFDRSTDDGQSWLDNDVHVIDIPGGWDYNIPDISRANGLPVTCCDLSNGPNRGTIYINWSDQRNGTDDTDVWLVKSIDGGDTWTEPARVNDDLPGKQQFFTWMTIDPVTGKLWFVFYDRRNYIDSNTDVYMAVSVDGGVSFTNFKVSESPFYPRNSVFFSDYTNISAFNDVIRPIWTRLDNFHYSILTAIIDPLLVNIPDTDLKPFAETKAFPNPFSSSVAFSYKLVSDSYVSLDLINSFGEKVISIIENAKLSAGKYKEIIDSQSLNLSPGVYYLKFKTGSNQLNHKIVFMP